MSPNCPLALCEVALVCVLLSRLAFGEVPSACRAFRMMLEAGLPRGKPALMGMGSSVNPRAFGSTRLIRRHYRSGFSDVDLRTARRDRR